MGIATNKNTHEISFNLPESASSIDHCAVVYTSGHSRTASDEESCELTLAMAEQDPDSSSSDDDYVAPEVPARLYEHDSTKPRGRSRSVPDKETWVLCPPGQTPDSTEIVTHLPNASAASALVSALDTATQGTCITVTSAPGPSSVVTSCSESVSVISTISDNCATREANTSDTCLYVSTSQGLIPNNAISSAHSTNSDRGSGYFTLGLGPSADDIGQDLETRIDRSSQLSIASSGRGASLMSVSEDSESRPPVNRNASTDSGCFEEVVYEITDELCVASRRPSGQCKEMWTGRDAQNLRKGIDADPEIDEDRDDYEAPFLSIESQEPFYLVVDETQNTSRNDKLSKSTILHRSDTEHWSPEKGRELYKKLRSSTLPSTEKELRVAQERLSHGDASEFLPSIEGTDHPSTTVHNIVTPLPPIEEQSPLSDEVIQAHVAHPERRPVPAPRPSLRRARSTPD